MRINTVPVANRQLTGWLMVIRCKKTNIEPTSTRKMELSSVEVTTPDGTDGRC